MASPVLDGYGASTTGAALAAVTQGAAGAPATRTGGFSLSELDERIGDVGIGLVVALLALAYWYRRIL